MTQDALRDHIDTAQIDCFFDDPDGLDAGALNNLLCTSPQAASQFVEASRLNALLHNSVIVLPRTYRAPRRREGTYSWWWSPVAAALVVVLSVVANRWSKAEKQLPSSRIVEDCEQALNWLPEEDNGLTKATMATDHAHGGRQSVFVTGVNHDGRMNSGVVHSLDMRSGDTAMKLYIKVVNCEPEARLIITLKEKDLDRWTAYQGPPLSQFSDGWHAVDIDLRNPFPQKLVGDHVFDPAQVDSVIVSQIGSASYYIDDLSIASVP